MRINVNPQKTIGKIKPMHAVGQPPIGGTFDQYPHAPFHYLTEANIPYSRLHDVGGYFGGGRFVDIPNIFRDFDADENAPENYDFVFTDRLITGLINAKVAPYYRLGVTIENYAVIKQYNQDPPKDFAKWARICEHIVAHYIDGWADGFHYDMPYWEIMCEPDSGHGFRGRIAPFWWGTPEQYYELYDITAKTLKGRFGDRIKVGGYSMYGFYYLTDTEEERAAAPIHEYRMDFFHGFMNYIKEHGSPLDFFSWHSYMSVEKTLVHADFLSEQLINYGYPNTESHLAEWNADFKTRGTGHHAAAISAMMLGMQRKKTDMLCLYDARISGGDYCPFFNTMTYKPWQGYYAVAAFGILYKLGTEIELTLDAAPDKFYAVAATDGKRHAIMISNTSGNTVPLEIEGVDLTDARWSVIDDARLLSWSPALKEIPNDAVVLIEF